MWGNSTSTLKADASEEMGQGAAPDDATLLEDEKSLNGSTAPGIIPRSQIKPQWRWSPDAVRRLDADVEWALTSNPTGAAEVVGVLLGKIGPTIEVMDCQPIFLMQPADRSHALAGPGRGEFERTIAAFQSIAEGRYSVVGFYRSHTGAELDLTEEDRGLIRACFPDASPVTLLVQPTADTLSGAKVFFGNPGEVLRQFNYLEGTSPLPRWLELWHSLSADDAAHSPEADVAKPTDTAESPQNAEPAHVVTEFAPIPAPVDAQQNAVLLKRRSNRSPMFLVAAALTLTILTGYLMQRSPARVKQEAASPGSAVRDVQSGSSHPAGLALRAEREGDNLRLDWDHTAPVLAAATGGMLTIREGNGRERQVMLDGNLLRRGVMVYRPVHGDVSLWLVIFGQEGAKMGESISSHPQ